MKKILSVVLAAAMMSTMAFAADATITHTDVKPALNPGQTAAISINYFVFDSTKLPADHDGLTVIPRLDTELSYKFDDATYVLGAKTFAKGLNLVDKVAIDYDNLAVNITFKQDFSKTRIDPAKPAEVVIKDLIIKARKAVTVGSSEYPRGEYKLNRDGYMALEGFHVGYAAATGNVDNASYANGNITNFSNGTASYGEVSFAADPLTLEGRVYKGDKIYVNVAVAPSDEAKAIMKDPANETADMSFVKFTTNGLSSNHKLFLDADEEAYIYKIVDGKLAPSGLKWSDDDYAWKGTTRGNVEFVISDIELKTTAAAAPETDNPDTGANDVVGVAAALAVISLVAAGAVSLKK